MPLAPQDRKQYRAIAHHLNPIILIGDKGLSDPVLEEIDRALNDHELIKIKMATTDREARQAMSQQILDHTQSEHIQTIGKVLIVLRKSQQPNPKLSNLLRYARSH